MKKIILVFQFTLLLITLNSTAQSNPCSLTGASIFIDNSVNPRIITANVNGSSNYSYSWLDTNGIQLSTLSQYPFYTQWCVTITDNITGCDTTICQDCIADSNALCMCIMIYMPVCGCDGVMYSNSCLADCADVSWTPAVPNGTLGGFLPCSTITNNNCEVEIIGDSIICNLNNPQILTASPSATTTLPATYQWYGNGMSSNSSILTINSPGTYCVTQTDANGCIDSACINVSVQGIDIFSNPNPPIICQGDSILLEFSNTPLNSILWFPTGDITSMIYDDPLVSTNYIVEGVDMNGCDRRGEISVIVDSCSITNIKNLSLTDIEVYPNPAKDKLTLNCNQHILEFSLINSQGVACFTQKNIRGSFSFKLDNYDSGIYYIYLQSEKDIIYKKLIIY